MNNYSRLYGSLVLTFLIGGCSAIGPDYAKPSTVSPVKFRFSDTNDSAQHAINTKWWETFEDAELSRNIDLALTNNQDLLSSQASVDSLLGKFDQAKSYLYPQINGNGSLDKKGVANATNNGYMLREGVTSTYAASLSLVSYEIDLFGKVRRANEAARALLLSSEYARQTLRISIASSVAASYIHLASLNGQIALAKENFQASGDIEQQSALKYRYGSINETIYLQSKSALESAKATLSQLQAAKISEEANFNLLLARNPQEVKTTSLDLLHIPVVPAALPSSILTNRPDIAIAEQNLIAANAQIGIARAAYYPSIKLTGMLGIQSLELSNFISNPAKIWEITPSITLPIFTAGLIEGEVKTAEAEHTKTLLQYQKAIISAFNDADNALGQNSASKDQLMYQTASTQAIQKAFKQSQLQYKVGVISYSDMLLVQQQWLQASQQNLIARQNALTSTVNLYKALGGGWEPTSNSLPELSLLPAGR
ncbi:MAG: efflux transporter outer membrane subunit [Campylobacterales bacterium]|nr:efflux transporter outer membrane subunit [Campylobacterales bacterium]